MILNINGELNKYYAQTLCMIFFPNADFSENQEVSESTPVVDINANTDIIGVTVDVSIKYLGENAKAKYYMSFKEGYTREKNIKLAAGKAMIEAGKKLFNCAPPWGILTGVRPSKIVIDLLKQDKNILEIKDILTKEYYINPKKANLVTSIALKENKIINDLPADSCSVYISVPFCPTRCAYCSFVSYSTKRLLSLIPEYLEQLYKDIDETFRMIKELNQRVLTIYIGGGTPTILSPAQLETLLKKISENINTSELLEYSIEAGRPDTITKEKLKIIKNYGVNRISINPQTLNDEVLVGIGRRHTAYDFFKAFDMAREVDIPIINTDLIAGLPGEGYQSFSKSVDQIIKLHPENIMFHTFCVKKSADILKSNTEIFSVTGGETWKSVDYSQIATINAGYLPYYMYRQKNTIGNLENVGFCLDGKEGTYNILIMEEIQSIFAVGAGSVTKLVSPDCKKIQRFFMPKYPYEYLSLNEKSNVKNDIKKNIYTFYETYYGGGNE